MVSDGNLADGWERVAAAIPDAPAVIQGDRTVTWRQLDRRADALAADLVAAGLGHQSKVAAYLTNCPEYLETYVAAFKAAMVPVNTNFRYGPDEVAYLFDNADAEAVVFHATYADTIDQVRAQLPKVRRWYVVDDGAPRPDWAVPYDDVASSGAARPELGWARSGDDILMLYTGGTTGMPKGVMWRQDDLFTVLGRGGNVVLGFEPVECFSDLGDRLTGPGPVQMPACPLMHGTGQFTAFIIMSLGGCVVCLEDRRFSAEALWSDVERFGVNLVTIVGDAFARPMLDVLERDPHRWDLSSVRAITSSGVMWSQEVKEGLLAHLADGTVLADSFGSSEAVGLGSSISSRGSATRTAKFELGERVRVFTDDHRPVEPGSHETGFVAITGPIPVGYHKDPDKTAATFPTIDGVRYSVPGDYARVDADGTLHLLGRGSVCINTGGEKVYPEEVEEALKLHPAVHDAVCVGVPDERFGQTVCAVVEAEPSAPVDADAVIAHVKDHLAHYKAPRHVVAVDTIGRAANGKVDYKRLTAHARQQLGR